MYHHLPMVSAIVKVHKLPWTSLENGHRTNKAFCDTTVNLFQQLQSQTNNGILKKVMYTFCHVIHGPNITWPKFVKSENFGQQYTWKDYSSFLVIRTVVRKKRNILRMYSLISNHLWHILYFNSIPLRELITRKYNDYLFLDL